MFFDSQQSALDRAFNRAFFASGAMAVAYFMVHAPKGFWPIENHGELAALYCWAFLLIAARGPGPWSLDALLRRR